MEKNKIKEDVCSLTPTISMIWCIMTDASSRVCKAAKSHLKTCGVCLKNKWKGILIKAALPEIRLSSLNPFFWRILRKLGLPAK